MGNTHGPGQDFLKVFDLNYAAFCLQNASPMPVFQFLMPLRWQEAVNWAINAQANSTIKPQNLFESFFFCVFENTPSVRVLPRFSIV